MYVIVGLWGSRERKIRAAYFLFLYTLLGSVLMLIGILYIYYQTGTTDYETLTTVVFTLKEEKLLWLALHLLPPKFQWYQYIFLASLKLTLKLLQLDQLYWQVSY